MAGKVTVALRLPSGLVIEHDGHKALLNGWNKGADGHTPNHASFAFTDGVDEDLFNGWLATQHEHKTALVTKDLVFAHANPQAARDQAAERERDVTSGFEGHDPENPMPGEAVKLEPSDQTRQTLDENRSKAPAKR
jgi:hypothetical protein